MIRCHEVNEVLNKLTCLSVSLSEVGYGLGRGSGIGRGILMRAEKGERRKWGMDG